MVFRLTYWCSFSFLYLGFVIVLAFFVLVGSLVVDRFFDPVFLLHHPFVVLEVGENDQGVSLKQPFVIIPQQSAPGKPIQLMMSLYNAFGKSDTITVDKDKIVFMTEPKDDLLKSYQSNTSTIISANTPGLITENSVPKL